jgi:hypothetical protein
MVPNHAACSVLQYRFAFLAGLLLIGMLFVGCIGGPEGPEATIDRQEEDGPASKSINGMEGVGGPTAESKQGETKGGSRPSGGHDENGSQESWRYDILPPTILTPDSGINPYHVDFRLPEGFDGMQEGYYPAGAVLLDLSLDADTLEEALEEDKAIWESLQRGVLYAFNGTRIVGAIDFQDCEASLFDCDKLIFDRTGHGSLVVSSAAGNHSGSCPECRIVMAHGPRPAVDWAISEPWIDVLSMSRATIVPTMRDADTARAWMEGGRTWFNSAGNGATGSANAANIVSERSSGPTVLVGGWYEEEDEMRFLSTRIYDVLGITRKEVALHTHMSEFRFGAGTSVAAPDAAGHYAWILWQVREALGDQTGFQDGVLARVAPGAPTPAQGPLSDGTLTARELEDVLRATARVVPATQGAPEGGPLSYLWAGYGLVDEESRERAVRVILGEEEMPERPWEDWWHEQFDYVREGFFTYVICLHHLFPLSLINPNLVAYLECQQKAEWDPSPGPDLPPDP